MALTDECDAAVAAPTLAAARPIRLVTRAVTAIRHDRLVANSFFIALSNASMGLLGFAFWVIAAHLYPPEQVGLATTLVSASILIGYASLLGFNSTFVRYLPRSAQRDDEINTGLAMVFVGALVIGTGYMLAVPSFAPQLEFLRTRPLETAAIVLFVAFGAVNLVTDAVFVAFRAAHYNVIVDGLLQGTVRLILPIAFVGLGAFGLFASVGVAAAAAVTASILFMALRLSYRPRLHISLVVLKRIARFGAANYVADMFTMAPIVVMPLAVLHSRGAAEAGYFYLALSITNMLYAVSIAISQSLFAEGSHRPGGLRPLARRAVKLQAYALVLSVLVILGAHRVLLVFGSGYARHGTTTLILLAAASPAVAAKHLTAALLRVRHQLGALVVANLAQGAIPCILAALLVHDGAPWVAVGWLLGNLAAGLLGASAVSRSVSRQRARAASNADHAGLGVPS